MKKDDEKKDDVKPQKKERGVEMSRLNNLIGSTIKSYKITRYINSGSFGDVFEAKDILNNNKLVALKIPIQNDNKNGQKYLLDEAKVYTILNKGKDTERVSGVGISDMKIIKNKDTKIIVMDLLGPSLENLLKTRKKGLRLKNIILLSIQLIDIMKYIHECGFLHRDIKPDNFVIGNNDPNKIYCIDFGLAKKYIKETQQIPFKDDYKFLGTARYASIAAHRGHEQSPKDDLEAIGYLLIYLFKMSLPWQNIKNKDKTERYRLIQEKKETITEEELCEQLPKEFLVYLKYVKSLEYDQKPEYNALKRMFIKLYKSKNYNSEDFDWTKLF